MKIPKSLKPPYQIGPNTFITTHKSRSADPASQPNLLQRVASHLPVKVRGPKPPATTRPGGDGSAPRPTAPSAPRAGQLPPPDTPKDTPKDTDKANAPPAGPAEASSDPEPAAPPVRPGRDSPAPSSGRASQATPQPAAEPAGKGKGPLLEPMKEREVDQWLSAPPATWSFATASRLSSLPAAAAKGPRVDFIGKHALPDELILDILGRLDIDSLKAWRLVQRATAGMGAEMVKHLNVGSGHDVPEALSAFPKALSLMATWDSTADAAAAHAIGSAPRLQAVSLAARDAEDFGDANVAAIARSASIKVLFVPGNHITWKGVEAVVREGRVEVLDLSHNPITSMFDSQHVSARRLGESQAIRGLSVASCGLEDADAMHLAVSRSIVKLVASHNRFGPDAAAAFAANGMRDPDAPDDRRLANGEPARVIEEIDLSGNPLGSAGVRALAATPTIRSMTLANTDTDDDPIVDDDMQELAGCASLRMLDVSGNRLGPEAARHLSTSTSLEVLHMNGNRLGDAGAQHLAGPSEIRVLALESCGIGDAGARALAAKPGLQALSLRNIATVTDEGTNDITDAGGVALAASSTLRKVDLSGTSVGDETAIAMARNPAILSLDLSGCPNITARGREALEARRHRFEDLQL